MTYSNNVKPTTKIINSKRIAFKNYWKLNKELYFWMIPGLMFLIIFKYIPMFGIVISFQDYNIFKGVSGSEWVGLANFTKLFNSPDFYKVFTNTLIISFMKIFLLFPLPIIVALVLNEIKNMIFKRTVQTIIYMPHFLSWVIVSGLFVTILSSGGMVNKVLEMFGLEPISFMMNSKYFRGVLIFTDGWKEFGWNTIIYLAAIASVDPMLYEAAKIDGAGRIKQIIHITIPSITGTIALLFILKLGHVLEAGFTQVLVMYNPVVYDVADIIDTYVYRMGISKMEYSFSTAVGLFKSVVGFILVISGNMLSKKFLNKSIW